MSHGFVNGPSSTTTGFLAESRGPGGCACDRRKGMGDLPTFFTDLTSGNITQAFADLFTNIDIPTLLLLAGGGYLIYRTLFSGKGGRRSRLSQARARADYELAKARVNGRRRRRRK